VNADDARTTLFEALREVAPEVDPTTIDPSGDLRDELDLDSMDLLNVVSRLEERLGIAIPERDTPGMRTVDETVAYLVRRTSGAPA
jgi:acyl carrier protein